MFFCTRVEPLFLLLPFNLFIITHKTSVWKENKLF